MVGTGVGVVGKGVVGGGEVVSGVRVVCAGVVVAGGRVCSCPSTQKQRNAQNSTFFGSSSSVLTCSIQIELPACESMRSVAGGSNLQRPVPRCSLVPMANRSQIPSCISKLSTSRYGKDKKYCRSLFPLSYLCVQLQEHLVFPSVI